MSTRAQAIFLVGIVFLIIVLIALNFALSRFGAFWQKEKEKPNPNPAVVIVSKSFSPPVKKEQLDNTPEQPLGSNHLVFFLPTETPVYSLISGKISYVGQKITDGKPEFENIIISNDKERLTVSYLLAAGSRILVEKDSSITEGEEIAKTGQETKGPGCLGGGNLGVYLFKEDKPAKLTKEMMK